MTGLAGNVRSDKMYVGKNETLYPLNSSEHAMFQYGESLVVAVIILEVEEVISFDTVCDGGYSSWHTIYDRALGTPDDFLASNHHSVLPVVGHSTLREGALKH
ncbi:hypothetical protein DPMN_023825 [Dreissena polymorpha]|uniref:Uncharacterized protein n=1 Tax=Dreissena polymorpha TaxID=45954 RepID=A0A9D4LLE6_DREPO|nr:hypothetical protein DPMN_023825 [Dreissena polymorpha]